MHQAGRLMVEAMSQIHCLFMCFRLLVTAGWHSVFPGWAGSSPSDFQSKLAQPFCAQLLRLTGDSEATCKVVHVVAATGRRLLQVCGRRQKLGSRLTACGMVGGNDCKVR